MKKFIEDFLLHQSLAATTHKIYETRLNTFYNFINRKKIDIENFTSDNFIEYQHYLMKKNYTNRYINNFKNMLNRYFLYLFDKKLISNRIDLSIVKNLPKTYAKKRVDMDERTFFNIYNNINDRYKLPIKLMFFYGFRITEVCNLKISDINFKQNKIKLVRKNDKTIFFDISIDIMQELKKLTNRIRCDDNDFIFLSIHNKQMQRQSVDNHIKKVCRKLDIFEYGCHDFRHAFSKNLVKCNYNMVEIQRLLGHENMYTTEVYIKSLFTNQDVNLAKINAFNRNILK